MRKVEFCKIMAPAVAAFQAKFDDEVAGVYHMALDSLGPEALQVSIVKAITTLKFFPKPAELIEMAGWQQSPAISAELAFETVSRARDHLSEWDSVNFGPLTNRVVAQLGGWPEVHRMNDAEWVKFIRRTFIEIYTNFAQSYNQTGPKSLTGMEERQNEHRASNGLPTRRVNTVTMLPALPGEARKALK